MFCAFWALTLVLICCELGQRLSNLISEINNSFDRIDWYLLPIEIQQMLPTIIMYTQKSFALNFFGTSSCSRKQFKKVRQNVSTSHFVCICINQYRLTMFFLIKFQVMNAGYKYFMVLRKIYK